MIEFISFLGLIILQIIFKNFGNEFDYATNMNSTISLVITFILFARAFLKICMDKMWKADKRFLLLSIFYFMLLIEGCLAVMFFGGELSRPVSPWPQIRVASQAIIYGFSIFLFLFVKYQDFLQVKLLGNIYRNLNFLDCILITALLICDFLITPTLLIQDPFTAISVDILFFILAIINITIVHFRNFWKHKKTLLQMFDNYIMSNREKELTKTTEKGFKSIKIQRELIEVLEKAPIRILEMNFLVKDLHNLMIQNGRDYKKATELCADFSAAIIKNLMKREGDFSYLPNIFLNFFQKHHKYEKVNKRGML